jgi:hypothetical protein
MLRSPKFPHDTARLASLLDLLPIPESPLHSLNIGCGRALEYSLMAARWGNWLHIGLDFNQEELREAPLTRVRGDGAFPPFPPQSFAFILVRHPDVIRRREKWRAVFPRLPELLVSGGVLALTAYSLFEYDFARDALPLHLLPISMGDLAPIDMVGRDRYVLAAIKS